METPTSFRLRDLAASLLQRRAGSDSQQYPMLMAGGVAQGAVAALANDHSSHPNFLHLAGLVCEAVLEVVFVALPGYLVAWSGMFDANSQKFVAELNTMVFTPCLIFTKLASQLNADKLADLIIIPIIFAVQTVISLLSAYCMARLFGFGAKSKKRQRNFIYAMGVFGNSNSLPISLVLSLSQTIKGLHWAKVPGDNDDEVGARGILYLMIFQQLGQLLRWTWGYSYLLKPASEYKDDERFDDNQEERVAEEGRYRDDPDAVLDPSATKVTDSGFGSGSQTPISSASSESSEEEERETDGDAISVTRSDSLLIPSTPVDPKYISNASPRSSHSQLERRSRSTNHITLFPNFSTGSHASGTAPHGWKTPFVAIKHYTLRFLHRVAKTLATFFRNLFRRLPSPLQKTLAFLHHYNVRFWAGVWRQMNPPLWAMLFALIVASVPKLQHLFFDKGTLVNNSITRAVEQSGGVAVPLILVVLGANLARSTLPRDQIAESPEEKKEERKLLYASLISRMLLPTVIMAPLLALAAKYVPVSILDDPIFIIVCFLLTGAPSALQLAQICQINGVYMGAMSNLLVASYVVAIFPSTLMLVLLALEVVEWAT